MYDLIIVGAGPAGITASVYAARKRLDLMVITQDIGGQAAWSGDIENYTGYQFITGPQLSQKFEEHMRKFGINLRENEAVLEVRKQDNSIKVKTDKGAFESRTLIIASGKRSRELGVPGENECKNKGLTYCATCDGPLFSGKDVAVIGGGNSALDAAIQLTKIARRVTIINIAPGLTGDPIMQEQLLYNPQVTILNNAKVGAVLGSKMVTGIKVLKDAKEETLAVAGVFVEMGLIPNSHFAGDVAKNELGEIKVNGRNETNIPGIFAAGDVTDVPEKQIIIAAGEGSKAALSAFRYLIQNRF
ncbi:MAG: FAD-dependent oxidoreductase [Candidatus Omnitrophica bacterium]|nr:FAD-dependent oxidoreductase [Candidatus Omnitrophota bacterium]